MSLPRKGVSAAKEVSSTSPAGGSPFNTASVARMAATGPSAQDQRSVMMEMIRSNPNIPAEQKKSILEQMNSVPSVPTSPVASPSKTGSWEKADLSHMEYEALLALHHRVIKEIDARKPQIKKSFLEEIKTRAAALGLTIEELFASPAGTGGPDAAL